MKVERPATPMTNAAMSESAALRDMSNSFLSSVKLLFPAREKDAAEQQRCFAARSFGFSTAICFESPCCRQDDTGRLPGPLSMRLVVQNLGIGSLRPSRVTSQDRPNPSGARRRRDGNGHASAALDLRTSRQRKRRPKTAPTSGR